MEIKDQPKLKFDGVIFPLVNFKSDKIMVEASEGKITINTVPKVFYPDKDRLNFKIVQEVTLEAENCFRLFIVAIGDFTLESEMDDKIKKMFVNKNAPAIMFPYIRAFISTFTANIGPVVGTLVIPTQFFKGELEEIPCPPSESCEH